MKKRFNNWVYRLAIKVFVVRLVKNSNKLTPDYLKNKGWVCKGGFWYEDGMKERDTIYISFDTDTYCVRHGEEKTFIANESSIEWFEMYYLLIHPDNGRYVLAGV